MADCEQFQGLKASIVPDPRFDRRPLAHVPGKRASPLLVLLPSHVTARRSPLLLSLQKPQM